jgi:aspartyl-tRNA(Asn)/glutamyl-tRNA(Gln) amidotransferase subunit C
VETPIRDVHMLDSAGCGRDARHRHGKRRIAREGGSRIVALSREEVEYVASLARLGLIDDEVTRMQDQLSSILEHIAAINRLDTDAIPPTAQVVALTNVTRPDVVTGSLPRDAVLANAPRARDGFFEVHAVLGATSEDAE